MRIVQVLGTSAGGTGRHVAGLAAGLVQAGHEVVVAAPPDELERFAVADSGARPVPLAVSTRPSRADARAVRVLSAVAAQADIVHAHGARVGALAALALGRSTVPLVTTLHNATPEESRAGSCTRVWSGSWPDVPRSCSGSLATWSRANEDWEHVTSTWPSWPRRISARCAMTGPTCGGRSA